MKSGHADDDELYDLAMIAYGDEEVAAEILYQRLKARNDALKVGKS